jgi:hypothetical protein
MSTSLKGGTDRMLIFSNSQNFNNSWSESSDVIGFPFSHRSIWRPKPTSSLFCHQGTPPVRSINISRSEPSDETWFPFCAVRFEDLNLPAYSAELAGTQNPLPERACVFSPPRLTPGVGTFQAKGRSFWNLVYVIDRLFVRGDGGSSERVSLRHHDPHLALEHFRSGVAHFGTSRDRCTYKWINI